MLRECTEQELKYQQLLSQRVTDPEQWQAVHRILPDNAAGALRIAMLRMGWGVMVDFVLLMTETPAQTATRLGGVVDYDERVETAVFSLRDSAEIFSQRYPTWNVQVTSKEKQHAY